MTMVQRDLHRAVPEATLTATLAAAAASRRAGTPPPTLFALTFLCPTGLRPQPLPARARPNHCTPVKHARYPQR